MKKYILLINIIFLIFSCKHSGDSTQYTIAIPIEDSVYSYKSCKTNEVEAICKFKCKEDTDISKLRNQNIEYKCTELEAALPDSSMGGLFNKKIIDNIVDPIREYDTLNILPVDYENFIEFDTIFSKYGKKSERNSKEITGCGSTLCKERPGTILNIWKKYKKNSTTIYQNFTFEDIGSIQWVMLFEKNQYNDLVPITLTYEEAKKACETYEFDNHRDWTLPNSNVLVRALLLSLENELFQNLNGNFGSYRVWTLDKEIYGLLRMSEKIEPIQIKGKIEDQKEYVICSRTFTLGD